MSPKGTRLEILKRTKKLEIKNFLESFKKQNKPLDKTQTCGIIKRQSKVDVFERNTATNPEKVEQS